VEVQQFLTSLPDTGGQRRALNALSPEKQPQVHIVQRLGGSRNRSGRYEEKNLLPSPVIEPRLLYPSARSLIAMTTYTRDMNPPIVIPTPRDYFASDNINIKENINFTICI
jgi:hypothetical protein